MFRSYKYFAFISYSRKDSKAAKWLQRRLEWFRFPVKLVAKERLPSDSRYLRPIYRDKTNLEVAHAHYWLNIQKAIEQSRFMVVVCSPDSAASVPVDKEVSHFLATHSQAHELVVPVILSGHLSKSGSSGNLCPSLQTLGSLITDRNLPTMVPDTGDAEMEGWENGFIGITCYLLNLQRDALVDHVRREERRQVARSRLVAALFAGLAMVAAISGVWAYQNGIQARTQRDEAKLQKQKAETQALIADEKSREATDQRNLAEKQTELAKQSAIRAQSEQANAEAHKRIAETNAAAAKAEKSKAEKSETRALQSKSAAEGVVKSMLVDLRDKLERAGKLELMDTVSKMAVTYFEDNPPTDATSRQLYAIACNNRGEALWKVGNFDEALQQWNENSEIAKRLADEVPTDVERQLEYGMSLYRLRHLYNERGKKGDLEQALHFCEESLKIFKSVADQNRSNESAHVNLGLAYHELGNILMKMHRSKDAREACEASITTLQPIADLNRSDSVTAGYLSNSYILRGRIAVFDKRQKDARLAYIESLKSIERFENIQPPDFRVDRQFNTVFAALADDDTCVTEEDWASAAKAARKNVDLCQRLADQDQANVFAKMRFCDSLELLADIDEHYEKWDSVRENYLRCLDIIKPLAELPTSTNATKRKLSRVYFCIGHVERDAALAQLPKRELLLKAKDFYESGLSFIKLIAKEDFQNAEAQEHLSMGLYKLSLVAGDLKDTNLQKTYHAECLEVLDRMVRAQMELSSWSRETYDFLNSKLERKK